MTTPKVTQFFKLSDHPLVKQDYISGPCGDIDIDEYFIPLPGKKYLKVRRGDWIIEDGDTIKVKRHGNGPELGDIGMWGGVLCKVTHVDGGLFQLTTPHGTVIESGWVWVAKHWKWPLSSEELDKYREYQADAARQRELAT